VCRVCAATTALLVLFASPSAAASPTVAYGVQDDAWLSAGGPVLERRLTLLRRLGVDVVRYTLHWEQIARSRPRSPPSPADRAYHWGSADAVLKGLRARGIGAVVTIQGTPRWANGGRGPNWAPTRARAIADFAYAAAGRFPWVKRWTIWNEPNQRRWLRPTSPGVYVTRLLNPAYRALHRAVRGARVAGGMTAARGGSGGVSPVAWIRGMQAAGAHLDAYAHHPYPSRPALETPWTGGCRHCATITMATLERLLGEVQRAFGSRPVWLTEYGYQSNPPEPPPLGVSRARQAAYVAAAARRVYTAPRVELLINFLVRDDGARTGWQSGFFTASGGTKPAYRAFMLPLTQAARRGRVVLLWGQVRPRTGRQPYRIRLSTGRGWTWVTGTLRTDRRGFVSIGVRARPGRRVQLWAPRDRAFSLTLRVQ
jgi:hypothetical protein